MSYKFNPFTGQLDEVGAGASGPAERYVQPFVIADWVSNSPDYTLTILATTHAKGINPNIQVLEQNGLVYDSINLVSTINAVGDVTLKVSLSPDNRFNGIVLII